MAGDATGAKDWSLPAGRERQSAPAERAVDVTRSEGGDYVVAAEVLAESFGLTADAFWREMKRGIVYGIVERGEGEDAGQIRLTFRYRAQSWSITLEDRA
ncbi:MAG: hypothetical protein JNM48_01120 [Rhodospirillales bacterium]|nr:hypothetical protein [Rhodospirillales bacterium]